jgi:hypothetical protein
VASGTQRAARPRDARAMATLLVLAGISYAVTSALAQKLGPRRPD